MYTAINEAITVAGVFNSKGFIPKKFQWKNTVYVIDQITLISNVKDGGVRKRYYSVMCQGNVYRVVYNRENEEWMLEEIWME